MILGAISNHLVNAQVDNSSPKLPSSLDFSKHSSLWIRTLEKVPNEKLQSNTFLFSTILTGMPYQEKFIREDLDFLVKGGLLTAEEVNAIAQQSGADVQTRKPIEEKFKGLLESGLLKQEHVEQLQNLLDTKQLTEAQMSYLCEKGVVLTLAQDVVEPNLYAFLRIPDEFLPIEHGTIHGIHKLLDPEFVSENLGQERADKILSDMQQSQLFVNIPNHCGETPIFREIREGSTTAVEKLLQLGARADFTALDYGDTPMHAAASQASQVGNGDKRILEMLIEHGGNKVIHHKNEHGETPLDCATYNPRNAQRTSSVVVSLIMSLVA